jgi:phage-related protein
LRAFPADARRRAGYELFRIQQGFVPTDWKMIPSVGAGACEIRIHTGLEHRVIYVARFKEAVYVLHAFEKRSWKTGRHDIAVARTRLVELMRARRER